VDDGRVCGILAVSRSFGDRDFEGEGLQQLLQRGIDAGLWTEEFANSRCVCWVGCPLHLNPGKTSGGVRFYVA
jgi:hypothetical protein